MLAYQPDDFPGQVAQIEWPGHFRWRRGKSYSRRHRVIASYICAALQLRVVREGQATTCMVVCSIRREYRLSLCTISSLNQTRFTVFSWGIAYRKIYARINIPAGNIHVMVMCQLVPLVPANHSAGLQARSGHVQPAGCGTAASRDMHIEQWASENPTCHCHSPIRKRDLWKKCIILFPKKK